MLVLGIAGGIASGKSAVSQQLVDLGARHIDADRIGHRVLEIDEVKAALCERWGEPILEQKIVKQNQQSTTDENGHELSRQTIAEHNQKQIHQLTARKIDRAAVAKIVFGKDAGSELQFLESVTHPRIRSEINRQLDEYKNQGAKAVVLDAALLFKAGWDRLCDYILFVAVPRKIRLHRAFERGWTEEAYDSRSAVQTSLEVKLRKSHVIIDNSGSLERTRTQVQDFWKHCVE